MAGDQNKVGEVYVEIKATGAENVAKEVQKAQAMTAQTANVSGISGFTAGPAMSMGGVSGPGGGASATVIQQSTAAFKDHAEAVSKAEVATEKLTESKKTLRQEMVSFRQNIMGTVSIIGSFATAIGSAIHGLIGFKNAARDVSNELKAIEDGFKITTNHGLTNFQTLTIAANDYYTTVQEGIDNERESATELFNALLSNSKIRADFTSNGLKLQIADSDKLALTEQKNASTLLANLEKINVSEKNRLDLMKEQASQKELKGYLSDFNREADAAIQATRRAELAELDGAARIRKQRDFDIEDLSRKKASTEDEDVRRMIDIQIKARERVAAADIAAIERIKDEEAERLRISEQQRIESDRRVQNEYMRIHEESRRALIGLDNNALTNTTTQILERLNTIARTLYGSGVD